MEKIHTSVRLKEIMKERNLRQSDILRLCEPYIKQYGEKVAKNDLSQYVSGKTEPGQRKLFILSKALNLNPSWLMGMDVPKTFTVEKKKNDIVSDIALELYSDEEFLHLVKAIYNLPKEQRPAVQAFLSALSNIM